MRLGRPLGVSGLPETARGPAFAAAVGLLIYPQLGRIEPASTRRPSRPAATGAGGYLTRMGRWIKESF